VYLSPGASGAAQHSLARRKPGLPYQKQRAPAEKETIKMLSPEKTKKVEAFWQAFLATLPPDAPQRQKTYVAEPWGDNPAMADELGGLIAAGVKTATCSTLWEWLAEGQALPEAGLLTIVLDGSDAPLCIIETSEVTIRPYNQVDAAFAFEEGEGDRSLAYWREVHWLFFTRSLAIIRRAPHQEMPLVCERFRVIYP
jgi:uncharacterized protein YhfF